MAQVFLGLGSNLGNQEENIRAALAAVRALGDVTQVSSFYETEPVGFDDQPWFLNAVAEFHTEFAPAELLTELKEIEKHVGREEGVRFGPRVLDIDILLYEDLILDTLGLSVPHPRMHERRFVLVPLAEIAPDVLHPESGKTVATLLEECADENAVEPATL